MESLNKYFDQKDIFGEKIMDETTRRNKIEKMSLKSDLQSSYYIVLGILFALFAFIIQTPNYTDLIKLIYSVIIGIVVIALIWRFYSEMNEINQLFP
jgi:heme O synthase-like polyprenyltransferase